MVTKNQATKNPTGLRTMGYTITRSEPKTACKWLRHSRLLVIGCYTSAACKPVKCAALHHIAQCILQLRVLGSLLILVFTLCLPPAGNQGLRATAIGDVPLLVKCGQRHIPAPRASAE